MIGDPVPQPNARLLNQNMGKRSRADYDKAYRHQKERQFIGWGMRDRRCAFDEGQAQDNAVQKVDPVGAFTLKTVVIVLIMMQKRGGV